MLVKGLVVGHKKRHQIFIVLSKIRTFTYVLEKLGHRCP